MSLTPAVLQHFAQYDPTMHEAIKQSRLEQLEQNTDTSTYFLKLCETIIGQQLSNKVAGVIETRFRALLDGATENHALAQKILQLDEQLIRNAGLSWAKVRALQNAAEHTVAKTIVWPAMQTLDEDTVMNTLTHIKGVGPWTAEMFLIFALGREDVFSFGDLGLQKGFLKLYGHALSDSATPAQMIVQSWSPYRSYACLALWRSLDTSLE